MRSLLHLQLSTIAKVVFLPFVWTSAAVAQSAPTYDQVYQTVIATHGGAALNIRNTQVSGRIAYRGETGSSFSLTLQSSFARLEVNKSTGAMIVVRQGQRSQSIRLPNEIRQNARRSPPPGPISFRSSPCQIFITIRVSRVQLS